MVCIDCEGNCEEALFEFTDEVQMSGKLKDCKVCANRATGEARDCHTLDKDCPGEFNWYSPESPCLEPVTSTSKPT